MERYEKKTMFLDDFFPPLSLSLCFFFRLVEEKHKSMHNGREFLGRDSSFLPLVENRLILPVEKHSFLQSFVVFRNIGFEFVTGWINF